MNEAEWLASTDPQPMLQFLHGKASSRKFRLFAIACCRRVWRWLSDERSRKAMEVSERYAEGEADALELLKAADEAGTAAEMIENAFRRGGSHAVTVNAAVAVSQGIATAEERTMLFPYEWGPLFGFDVVAAAIAAGKFAAFAVAGSDRQFTQAKHETEREAQASLVRCIFGPISHPTSLDPAWLSWNDGTVRKLAQASYDERAFDHLPILADALEEAGCTDADILSHCRQPGEHVRGCWVVDLLLGKS